jgi:hypothetical protein
VPLWVPNQHAVHDTNSATSTANSLLTLGAAAVASAAESSFAPLACCFCCMKRYTARPATRPNRPARASTGNSMVLLVVADNGRNETGYYVDWSLEFTRHNAAGGDDARFRFRLMI